MVSPLSSATSAISSFSVKMDVTANNIANVNTDGFKKSRTTLQEGKNGGVQPVVDRVDTPGLPKLVSEDGVTREVENSNVDLAEELTETIPTQTAYSANLKTIQTADDMLGSLLDTIG
ncbi:flagellar basal body rod C-terminal domain-containing protein [uncultured Desulfosarcina sp.]|uniref:flagellar basal body rod protein FlgC n=1 Tax=uncultured Desulfosarcina sp. TaxID=218289 RepID=UPI0029C90BE1|nr:flagellar basal body rod C-terminal domain-containing protein [uncultured Desulfosarcina sp.]